MATEIEKIFSDISLLRIERMALVLLALQQAFFNSKELLMSSILHCPRCHSLKVSTYHHARKIGSAIGAVAGATSSVASMMAGAEVGATLGMSAGPAGAVFGGLAGALMGAFLGGAAGSLAGATAGEAIDTNILDNHECLNCGHTFGKP